MDVAAQGAIKTLFSAEASRPASISSLATSPRRGSRPARCRCLGSFISPTIRALHRHGLKPEIDFIYLASYDGERISQGQVRVLRDVESDIRGRNVVIVDDIFDSGRTLAFAKASLVAGGAARVLTCVLLDKQVPRAAAIVPDLVGFSCPPVFVVGYGLDLHNRYRELPFIGELSAGQ
jgi:hypoxanthine phosphoribosyltransferase